MTDVQVCRVCGQTKPLILENFYASAQHASGFNTLCRLCKNNQVRTRYAHPDVRARINKKRVATRASGDEAERYRIRRSKMTDEMKEEARAKSRLYNSKNKLRIRLAKAKKAYGIGEAEHASLRARQDGKCAVCGIELDTITPKHVHIDHCHLTKRVRGILCHKCNVGIGHFNDDVPLLRKAILYLESSDGHA